MDDKDERRSSPSHPGHTVQIPLWTIRTRKACEAVACLLSSDSSMDDKDNLSKSSLSYPEGGSDSSMDDKDQRFCVIPICYRSGSDSSMDDKDAAPGRRTR